MRVLHVHAGNLFGGVERAIEALTRHAPSEVRFEMALCFDEWEAWYRALMPVHMLRPWRLSRPWTALRARRLLRDLLRRERYDAVLLHSDWSQAVFTDVAQREGVPVVRWYHSPSSGMLGRLARWQRPDLELANSGDTRRALNRDMPVMYYPVEPPTPKTDRVNHRIPLPPRTAIVLMVARMEAWKGHATLIRALAEPGCGHLHAWFAGGAQRPAEQVYLNTLKELAFDLGVEGRVTFLGQVEDMAQVFEAAAVVCQPNQEPEPFGIAIIEALWSGCAVIATRAGGPAEIVTPECGVLLPHPATPEDVAVALRDLTHRNTEHLAYAAVARAQVLCDPSRAAARICRFIGSLPG